MLIRIISDDRPQLDRRPTLHGLSRISDRRLPRMKICQSVMREGLRTLSYCSPILLVEQLSAAPSRGTTDINRVICLAQTAHRQSDSFQSSNPTKKTRHTQQSDAFEDQPGGIQIDSVQAEEKLPTEQPPSWARVRRLPTVTTQSSDFDLPRIPGMPFATASSPGCS